MEGLKKGFFGHKFIGLTDWLLGDIKGSREGTGYLTVWSRVHHKVIVSETGNATGPNSNQKSIRTAFNCPIQLTQRPVQLCRSKLCLQPGPLATRLLPQSTPLAPSV